MKLSYSKKMTLLMLGLSIFNGVTVYVLTGSSYLFSLALITTYVAQLVLVFALGKVKTKSGIECSLNSKNSFEFCSRDIQELIMSNPDLLPSDIQRSIINGANYHFSVTAVRNA